MKYLIFFFLIFLAEVILSQNVNRQQLRDSFLRAAENKNTLDSLVVRLEQIESKTPAEESYYGICNGLYCQYDESNWAKLKHVMKSKNHLNNAVERDPKDPELRFMRLMLEHFLPSFLGLNKHIPEDLKVILANPNFIDENLSLKKKVIEFLLWSKRCTPEQNKLLEEEKELVDKKLSPANSKKG
jgi:hypothetical protein